MQVCCHGAGLKGKKEKPAAFASGSVVSSDEPAA